MRDVNKVVRISLRSALDGIAPIYDKVPDGVAAPWIRVGSQINVDNSTKDCVNTEHTATIEVVTRFATPGGGKEQSDDISDTIKQTLFDGTKLALVLSDSDLIAWDGMIENDFTDEFLDDVNYVVRRIIQLTITVQQITSS